MSRIRAGSSVSTLPQSTSTGQIECQSDDDRSLEGIATNVTLLLKLINDQTEAKENVPRKTQRVGGMISIIDDVKTRIQTFQNVGRRKAELRRCNTDLRPNAAPPKEKTSHDPDADENEKLRKSLSASLSARKSLEIMCTSLGKEKEIIVKKSSREKVHEFQGMEEHINDLKAHNNMLLAKVQACASKHKLKCWRDWNGWSAGQERNQELTRKLHNPLDRWRTVKRKIKVAKKENYAMHMAMGEIGMDVQDGLGRIRCHKEGSAAVNANINEEFSALEHLFESWYRKISEHEHKKFERSKPEVNAV